MIFIKNYVNLSEYPVKHVLGILLSDRTTGKNIIFATNDYRESGFDADEHAEITTEILIELGDEIQPRVSKSQASQASRTKTKAEVFTPSWICNKMNNFCDEEWFGYKDVFNWETEQGWKIRKKKFKFPKDKSWQDYVLSKRLEITCGEAPYIVSRYDTTTGDYIETKNRIGILDRKIRVITANAKDRKEWLKWVYIAYQSVYGYEFQGDNLLIARVNLLNTFCDYLKDVWGKKATKQQLKKVADIISWNVWQMDGLKGTIPFGELKELENQISIFEIVSMEPEAVFEDDDPVECVIKDWVTNKIITYNRIKEGK